MGTDLQGRDLGKGLDQLPSGLYRLRTMLHGNRLGETHKSLEYLVELRDKVERLKRDSRVKGILTQLTSFMGDD
jgi:hypothetical protein